MTRKTGRNSKQRAWQELAGELSERLPHFAAWYGDDESFRDVKIKAMPDGTLLTIARGYDSGGGPVVCFGMGYDVSAALLAIDAAMNGGRWKVDEPWEPGSK